MAYFWDYILAYPIECSIIIAVALIIYIGWIKSFWYLHKPSIFCGKEGEWRIERYVGRIVRFENKKDIMKFTKNYKEVDPDFEVTVHVYIGGQPIRRMKLKLKDLLYIRRNSKKFFKREYIINKKYLIWHHEENAYVFSDKKLGIYMVKPEVLERYLLNLIDRIDIKASRGSRVAPQLVHSGYFQQHLAIPPDEYEENKKKDQISEFDYESVDVGKYGNYPEVKKDSYFEGDKEDEDVEVNFKEIAEYSMDD